MAKCSCTEGICSQDFSVCVSLTLGVRFSFHHLPGAGIISMYNLYLFYVVQGLNFGV